MSLNDSVPLPEIESLAVEATVDSVCRPGATFGGVRRRELAETVREAMDDRSVSTSDPESDLAVLFTNHAHTIRESTVADILASGVTEAGYVEILSLCSRMIAVDTMHFALGLAPAPLPPASPGEPTANIDPDASIDGGWIPTVGAAYPPTALSMLPDDHDAMHKLHGALYLTIPEMADSDISRGLHRTQMELVAARTSLLNECFF